MCPFTQTFVNIFLIKLCICLVSFACFLFKSYNPTSLAVKIHSDLVLLNFQSFQLTQKSQETCWSVLKSFMYYGERKGREEHVRK